MSKDVALDALFSEMRMNDMAVWHPSIEGSFSAIETAGGDIGDGNRAVWQRHRLLALLLPDAILIDPTAPETVAALTEALIDRGFLEWFNGGIEFPETAPEMAAAILPAFIARLRGEA